MTTKIEQELGYIRMELHSLNRLLFAYLNPNYKENNIDKINPLKQHEEEKEDGVSE